MPKQTSNIYQMWCLKRPIHNDLWTGSISITRKECIKWVEENLCWKDETWRKLYRQGWRIVKVDVSESGAN